MTSPPSEFWNTVYSFLLALLSYICFISQIDCKMAKKELRTVCHIPYLTLPSTEPCTVNSTLVFANCTNAQCWGADRILHSSTSWYKQVGTWTQFHSRSQSLLLTEKLNLNTVVSLSILQASRSQYALHQQHWHPMELLQRPVFKSPTQSEILGVGLSKLCLTCLPGSVDIHLSLTTTELG